MTRTRKLLAAIACGAILTGAFSFGVTPAGAATVDVECVGADPTSIALLGAIGGPIQAGVSGRIEPNSVNPGANDLDFFVGLILPQSLITAANDAGVTEATLADVSFTVAPGTGVTGANVVGTPADQTIDLTSVPDIEVGPFAGTFNATGAIGSDATWNFAGASMRISVQIAPAPAPPIDINITCTQTGSGAVVLAEVLAPVVADGPVVGPLSATTDEGTAVDIDLNAGISDGPNPTDLSTLSIIADPSSGTVTLGANGVATYTPDDGFVGEDTFVYEVCTEEVGGTPDTTTSSTTSSTAPPTDLVIPVVDSRQGGEVFCNSNVVTVTVVGTPEVTDPTTSTTAPGTQPPATPQNVAGNFTG